MLTPQGAAVTCSDVKMYLWAREMVQYVSGLATKAGLPEFHPWDPHHGREELHMESSSVTSAGVLWLIHIPNMNKIKNAIFKKMCSTSEALKGEATGVLDCFCYFAYI